MSDSREDQIHAPTPTRREQARREGDIPKSFELAAAIQMLGALALAYLVLGGLGRRIRLWTTETWSEAGSRLSISSADFTEQVQSTTNAMVSSLAPLLLFE